jgi:4-carboxymuconolactone decarboxylase
MARIPEIPVAQLTDAQRLVHDQIAGARAGAVAGPFAIWLHLPQIADRANQFGNTLRLQGALEKRLFELIVLITARHWSSQYEWFAHEEAALKAGLSAEVVEAIRVRRVPDFTHEDERLIFETVTELYETRTVSQSTYERALKQFGPELLIEAVTTAGFYSMAAMVINSFDAPVPGGRHPLP